MKNKIVNASSLKKLNRDKVLNCIRNGISFRADIARMTSLTRASITNIVDELIEEGLVIEAGSRIADSGKKVILLKLNTKSKYALGIMISENIISISVVDLYNNAKDYERIKISKNSSYTENLLLIDQTIDTFINKYGKKNILGIGVLSPGPIDEINGIILNPPNLTNWHNAEIAKHLEEKYNLKVFLDKEINGIALLEKQKGAATNIDTFIEILLDDGIGSSILVDNILYRGLGYASEFGHTSINPLDGITCNCGNKGCIELYCSSQSLLKNYNDNGFRFDSWDSFVKAILDNDQKVLKYLDNQIELLSFALINFLNIINIDTIILNGKILTFGSLFAKKLEDKLQNKTLAQNTFHPKIILSTLRDIDITAPGIIVLEKYFDGSLLD